MIYIYIYYILYVHENRNFCVFLFFVIPSKSCTSVFSKELLIQKHLFCWCKKKNLVKPLVYTRKFPAINCLDGLKVFSPKKALKCP